MKKKIKLNELLLLLLILFMPLKLVDLAEFGSFRVSIPNVLLLFLVFTELISYLLKSINTKHNYRFFHSKTLIIYSIILFSLVVILLVSVINSDPNINSLLPRYITIFLLLYVIIKNINNIDSVNRFFVVVLISSVYLEISAILSSYGIYDFSPRSDELTIISSSVFTKRTPGLIGAFGDHAILLSISFPYLIYKFFNIKRGISSIVKRLLIISTFAILILGTLASQSRNIWLSSLFSVLLFGFIWLISVKQTKVQLYFWGFFVLLSLGFVFLTADLDVTFFSDLTQLRISTVMDRLNQYDLAIYYINLNIIWGYGHSFFISAYGLGLHNIFLSILIAGGILSFTPMLIALVLIWKNLHKIVMLIKRDGIIIIVYVSFLTTLFASQFFYPLMSWFFWSNIGLSLALINIFYKEGKTKIYGQQFKNFNYNTNT